MRMGVNGESLCGWWLVSLFSMLSVASLAAAELRLADAVEMGDKEAVRSLLAEHVDVNTPQADGATPLAWAAHRDDLETAGLLIRAGADANTANNYGVTPLSLACTNRSAAMVKKLLEAGADPNAAQPTGETALMSVFAANPGVTLTRQSLSRESRLGGNERAVDVHIARLRRKVEENPKTPRYIQTVWGEGYVLRAGPT